MQFEATVDIVFAETACCVPRDMIKTNFVRMNTEEVSGVVPEFKNNSKKEYLENRNRGPSKTEECMLT